MFWIFFTFSFAEKKGEILFAKPYLVGSSCW